MALNINLILIKATRLAVCLPDHQQPLLPLQPPWLLPMLPPLALWKTAGSKVESYNVHSNLKFVYRVIHHLLFTALHALVSSLSPSESRDGKLTGAQMDALTAKLDQILGNSGDEGSAVRRDEKGQVCVQVVWTPFLLLATDSKA